MQKLNDIFGVDIDLKQIMWGIIIITIIGIAAAFLMPGQKNLKVKNPKEQIIQSLKNFSGPKNTDKDDLKDSNALIPQLAAATEGSPQDLPVSSKETFELEKRGEKTALPSGPDSVNPSFKHDGRAEITTPSSESVLYKGDSLLVEQTEKEVIVKNTSRSKITISISWDKKDPNGIGMGEDSFINFSVSPEIRINRRFDYHTSVQIRALGTTGTLIDYYNFDLNKNGEITIPFVVPLENDIYKSYSLLVEQTEKEVIVQNTSRSKIAVRISQDEKDPYGVKMDEDSSAYDSVSPGMIMKRKFNYQSPVQIYAGKPENMDDNYLILLSVTAFIILFIILAGFLRFKYHAKKDVPIDMPMPREEMPPPKPERVEFAVFSPLGIVSGSKFKLDVWAYLPSHYKLILSRARELKREDLLEKEYDVPVERDTILSVLVEIDMLEVTDSTKIILWKGDPTKASYSVNVPDNTSIGQYAGKASISYKGMVIAIISFFVSVTDTERHDYVNNTHKTFLPRTAFASYASKDRQEVATLIRGMKTTRPDFDIFFDHLSLRSGENWKDKIEQHVPNKDIFYLFWSNSAAKSEWVDREWHLALSMRGLDYIKPISLEDLEAAPLPPELASLHSADPYLPCILYEKLKKKTRVTN